MQKNKTKNLIILFYLIFSFSFIVLEHDLFEITVDLAVGYTLDMAMNFQPKLDVSFISIQVPFSVLIIE